MPIPSFHAERERLARLFSSDDSDDDDDDDDDKRKKIKIPIPNFSSTPNKNDLTSDDEDDELNRLLLVQKPIFGNRQRKLDDSRKENITAESPKNRTDGRKHASSAQSPSSMSEKKADSLPQQATGEGSQSKQRLEAWTESDVLSWAVNYARGLNPFNMKKVFSALRKQMGDTSWTSDKSRRDEIRRHVRQCLEPSEDALRALVDEKVQNVKNVEAVEPKRVVALVQEHFSIPLTLASKRRIKARLVELLKEKAGQGLMECKKHVSSDSVHQRDENVATLESTIDGDHKSTTEVGTGIAMLKLSRDVEQPETVNRHSHRTAKCGGPSHTTVPACPDAQKAEEIVINRANCTNPKKYASEIKESTSSRNSICGKNALTVAEDSKASANDMRPTRRRRNRKTAAESALVDDVGVAPEKPRRSRKRKGNCQLCINCPCSSSSATTSTINFPQSDSAIERALIKRVQKIEKAAEQYENQADAARRTLKKHRREMWKKRDADEAVDQSASRKSRFLPDVDELDLANQYVGTGIRLTDRATGHAQDKVFGVVPKTQPTLTQMFGRDEGPDECDTLADPTGRRSTIAEKDEEVDSLHSSSGVNPDFGDTEQGAGLKSGESNEADIEWAEQDVVPHSRFEWNGGPEKITSCQSESENDGIWQSMLTGSYGSLWESVVRDPIDYADDAGMDDLLGLFSDSGSSKSLDISSQSSTTELAMLSQRGQRVAEGILEQVSSDSAKLAALEHECPNWKENVLYAMRRRDFGSSNEALKSVQEAKVKLLRGKTSMLEAFDRKAIVLRHFEDILQQSLARSPASSHNAFVLSQESLGRNSKRESMESEVRTLVPSGTQYEFDSPLSIKSRESALVN